MATIEEALAVAFAHHQAGRLQEAEAIYRQVLRAAPAHPAALHLLGLVAHQSGRHEEAVELIEAAVALRPEMAAYHNNLGEAYRAVYRLGDAVRCYRRALELRPEYAEACSNLGNALKDRGEAAEAVACYEQALRWKPDFSLAYQSLLGALQYCDGMTLARLAEAHAGFQRRYAAGLRAAWHPHPNPPDPDRPLRVGLVSGDFCRHPVGYLMVRALEHLDPARLAILCYSHGKSADDLTARIRAVAAAWRETGPLSDEALCQQIRDDRVDILFDLAGHTAGNRLSVFARKPAPIQITWLGHVGTTGLDAMDCILADRYEIPAASEPYYRERVLRMPDGYVCYDPPAYAPPVGPLPAMAAGRVTFASFQNPAKITPRVIALWSKILHRTAGSRLLLKFRGWEDETTRRRYLALFAAEGVGPEQVELQGWSPHAEHLAAYHRVDLALDTFPYSGGLTTCEALWMGVPVVTCPGETFASRHGLSHLSNVGLTETIAGSPAQYVELAVSLAGELPRLAVLRARLRPQVAASPLCDGKRFAANLTALLGDVWQQWVAQNRKGTS